MRSRILLLAGAGAIALIAAQPSPARAQLSQGELTESLDEFLGEDSLFGEAMAAVMEALLFIVSIFTPPANPVGGDLGEVYGGVGQAPGSYLPDGAELETMFPEAPVLHTPDLQAEYAATRLIDRKERVAEAMDVASRIARQVPIDQATLEALSAVNKAPPGTTAAVQLGNEVALHNAKMLSQLALVTSELGQVMADEQVKQDWQQVQSHEWAKAYFGENGMWAGVKTWTPETLGGW